MLIQKDINLLHNINYSESSYFIHSSN